MTIENFHGEIEVPFNLERSASSTPLPVLQEFQACSFEELGVHYLGNGFDDFCRPLLSSFSLLPLWVWPE
jgi:hypothetical protein